MGVATQNPELRKHFMGRYEYLVNYFTFLAQEVREYLAEMGFKTLNDIVGRVDLIETKDSVIDFRRLLNKEDGILHFTGDEKKPSVPLGMQNTILDQQMIAAAKQAIEHQEEVNLDYAIKNTNRAVGTMLSGMVAMKYGQAGLPDDTINVKFKGSAGQSFGVMASGFRAIFGARCRIM